MPFSTHLTLMFWWSQCVFVWHYLFVDFRYMEIDKEKEKRTLLYTTIQDHLSPSPADHRVAEWEPDIYWTIYVFLFYPMGKTYNITTRDNCKLFYMCMAYCFVLASYIKGEDEHTFYFKFSFLFYPKDAIQDLFSRYCPFPDSFICSFFAAPAADANHLQVTKRTPQAWSSTIGTLYCYRVFLFRWWIVWV